MIKIKDKYFQPFISEDKIQNRIKEMGKTISNDYVGKTPVLICVLTGSVFFTTDLMREISLPSSMACIKISSYEGLNSTENCIIELDLKDDLKGKDLIIVEDIIDTGNTLNFLLNHLKSFEPATIKIASLLLKPKSLKHAIHADYIGFEIDPLFVLGYGLDYDEEGRGLKDIYQLVE